jgi:hypothetical protein
MKSPRSLLRGDFIDISTLTAQAPCKLPADVVKVFCRTLLPASTSPDAMQMQ